MHLLAHQRIVERLEQRRLHRRRQQRIQQLPSLRAELVLGAVPLLGLLRLRSGLHRRLQGQQLHHLRRLPTRRDVPHVDHPHRRDLPRREPLHVVLGQLLDLLEARLVPERVRLRHRHLVELQEAHALLAHQLDAPLLGRRVRAQVGRRRPQHRAVVRPAQPAVGGDHQRQLGGVLDLAVRPVDQRVRDVPRRRRQLRHQPEHALGVGLGRQGPLLGLGELAGGDHLHRLGDAADVAHRLDALADLAGLGHGAGV